MGVMGRLGSGGVSQTVFVGMLYSVIPTIPWVLSMWMRADMLMDQRGFGGSSSNEMEFDFIVVGSGSTGAVVANRLSENPDWRILLIEAGGEPNPLQMVPSLFFFTVNRPETDWKHYTVPTPNASLALNGQRTLLSQGKSLGGTSNINWMIHLRGNPKDFDNWAGITGDESWAYENLLPYFRKSEDYRGEWQNNSLMHGKDGPMRVEEPGFNMLGDDVIRAGQELGYKYADLNGYYTEGFDKIYMPLKRGLRGAVYSSYIQPARRRSNLVIRKYAHVNKVIIDEYTKEAIGVEYDRHGKRHQAFAKKEVILSAGAMQSPKLLMLSGIGKRQDLEALGIRSVADLPVGENLQDHIATMIGFTIDERKSAIIDKDLSFQSLGQLAFRGTGPFTSAGTVAAGIFSSTWAKERSEGHWPDLLLLALGAGFHRTFLQDITRPFNIVPDSLLVDPYIGKDAIGAMVSVGRPTSRGYLRLSSANPYDPLIIDPRYYDTPEDIYRTVEAIEKTVQLLEGTQTFRNLGGKLIEKFLRPCQHLPVRTTEYWKCHLLNLQLSFHHVVGTAAMGRRGDPRAVVDSELRVIGVQKLRVMDASVMPIVPVSNTQAPCIMIGEKGADLLKRAWA